MAGFNGFVGQAKRLDDIDLPRIGARIGVGEDVIHALIEVETKGGGFDPQGRPRILFEPHVFHRNLNGRARDKAIAAGLAYPKWGTKPYGKESEQYPKLQRAMAIDETAALKACSWGLGQVLGENFAMVGFPSVQAMVLAFMEDEETHLEAIIAFVKAAKIDDDLRLIAKLTRPSTADDWRPVASAYNGPKYAKHGYHTRLAAADNKWRKIPDTPWSPSAISAAVEAAASPPPAPATAMTEYEVRALQQQLQDALYTEVGRIDGDFGGRTKAALFAFQVDNGLPTAGTEEGIVNAETRAFIVKNGIPKRKIAAARAEATAESLAKEGSLPAAAKEAQRGAFWSRLQLVGGSVTAILYGARDYIGDALSAISPLRDDLSAVGPWLVIAAVIGVAAIMYLRSQGAVDAAVVAVRKGQDTGV